ncbi:MAG: hypothetical protein PF482_05285 [Desulfobacteraceae bacterium]|nr:hypothetical protein [Desulfobacteraceae bacterium]
MKNLKSKTRVFTRIVMACFLATTIAACGLISVDHITDADNNQVVNIGDSVYALSGEINDFLHSWAGQTFRRYSFSGDMIADVADQYIDAKNDNPDIDIIFMDGGANDILIPATLFDPYNCKVDWWESSLSSSCKSLIDDIYVDAVNLLNQMDQDGVDKVIYSGYYDLKFGLIGTTALNDAVDYGQVKLSLACSNSTVDCTFVNPQPIMTSSDLVVDGVHPTTSGSEKIAGLIWPVLEPLLGGTVDPPPPVVDPDDLDGDGVVNKRDKCPDTPPGVIVDRKGCAI